MDEMENLAQFLQCAAESCCKERFGMCKTATKGIRTKVVPLSVEGLFNKLEENQRLLKSLEAESPAKNKAGGSNQSDKREPNNLWLI
jgi:hypothetical protein